MMKKIWCAVGAALLLVLVSAAGATAPTRN